MQRTRAGGVVLDVFGYQAKVLLRRSLNSTRMRGAGAGLGLVLSAPKVG